MEWEGQLGCCCCVFFFFNGRTDLSVTSSVGVELSSRSKQTAEDLGVLDKVLEGKRHRQIEWGGRRREKEVVEDC